MSILLCIDTSTELATICLSENGKLIGLMENKEQKDHAAWLHVAVEGLLRKHDLNVKELGAVAVTSGPGSYTGLRVGLSAAKGYCYALKIPLISLSTLEVMAHSVKEEASDWICPMIDARRMEVFTAIYDKELSVQVKPLAMILQREYFESLAKDHPILCCGNGSKKLRSLTIDTRISFTSVNNLALSLISLGENDLKNGNFSDIAYHEPQYLKDFHSSTQPGSE